MKLKRYLGAIVALVMLAAAFGGCEAREAAPDNMGEEAALPEGFQPIEEPDDGGEAETEPADLSFEGITEGLELFTTEEFILTRPEEDIETVRENYYITGVSDPAFPLRMNGITVEHRGGLGSFGAYVPLELGENRFRFEHGEDEETILTITRLEYEDYVLTDTITNPQPAFDLAVRADGTPLTLSCVAPAGALVTATVGDQTVEMTQSMETDVDSLPVTFTAAFDPGEINGTVNLGPVTYIMSRDNGTKSVSSAGGVFAVGAEDELLVRVNETAVTTFNEEADDSGFYSALKRGAVDRVDTIGDASMYRLASGGWVFQRSVEPLTINTPYESTVSDVVFERGERLETIILHGTAAPPYSAALDEGVLSLTLYHTTFTAEPDLSGSELVTAVESLDADGGTTLALTLDMDKYWGYLVQYDGADTILTLKSRPEPGPAERPLAGVTVALDPGHGGTDNGAAGVALSKGAMEKEINLAAAVAAKRYLEGLGAAVIMTREGDDEKLELDEILAFNEEHKPDFFLSLHSNSLPETSDGTEPSGVEIFYYEDSDALLAESLAELISERTVRVNRGGKQDYYKVTLGSLSRSLLIEMGFLTNPEEYDSLRTPENIYATAVAIGDGLAGYLTELQAEEETEPEA